MQEEYYETVSIGSCFMTILISAISLCVLLVPVYEVPAYQLMPIIGNGEISIFNELMLYAFADFVGLSDSIQEYFAIALEYGPYAYIGIPLLNVVFALLLIITRSEFLRKIFKFLSVLFGLAMTIIMLSQLVIIIGFIGQALEVIKQKDFNIDLKVLIFPGVMLIASSIMARKQFKWFQHA